MIKEIKSIKEYIYKLYPIPIGLGSTAICFRTFDNKVLKIYLNTTNKKNLFKCKNDMISHLESIVKLKNNSYVPPETILVKDNKCIGYIYNYVYL